MLAWLVLTGRFTGTPLLLACLAGVLSSIMPYVADLLALRRLPARLFAVTMSLNPLFAATAGVLVLDEAIEVHEWIGMAAIVLVNVVAAASGSRRSPPLNADQVTASEPALDSSVRTAAGAAADCESRR